MNYETYTITVYNEENNYIVDEFTIMTYLGELTISLMIEERIQDENIEVNNWYFTVEKDK